MTRENYRLIENYMLECMDPHDMAHGTEHIRRVLYAALDIAAHEKDVNTDVLICACLLHDIARKAQTENPAIRHPIEGARMANEFLINHDFSNDFADRVASCIRAHSDRKGVPCESIEAKILFDADKLDAAGALGIARTLQYGVLFSEPLYSRDTDGEILDGTVKTGTHSFLHEYHFSLAPVYERFHTARAAAIAAERRPIAEALLSESREAELLGKAFLENLLC